MNNNVSWRDSMECFIILKQIPNSDYAFIAQRDIIIYGKKWRSYEKISKQFDFVTLNVDSHTATRFKIEKIIQKRHRRYEDSDTNLNRFAIQKMGFDYNRAVDFFN